MSLNLNEILPLACDWVASKESEILEKGEPLSSEMLEIAHKLDIQNSQKVKIFYVDKVPIPNNLILQEACRKTNLISDNTAGLTLRYGIYIVNDYQFDKNLIIHELVHVSQYERLGGIEQFLKSYLYEVLTIGYPEAPMEQEAINKSKGLLK